MNSKDIKMVGLVGLGVLVAGAALYFLGDLPGVNEARRGLSGQKA